MFKIRIGLVVACLLALVVPATADAKAPKVQSGLAKHYAWEISQDYADYHSGSYDYAQKPNVKCIRRSRSVIDCHTDVLFYSDYEVCRSPDGTEHDPYSESDVYICWPGSPGTTGYTDPDDPEWDLPAEPATPADTLIEGWFGKWHSWTLRVRAHRGWTDWYIKGDRYASIDPTNNRFGGTALKIEYDEGEY